LNCWNDGKYTPMEIWVFYLCFFEKRTEYFTWETDIDNWEQCFHFFLVGITKLVARFLKRHPPKNRKTQKNLQWEKAEKHQKTPFFFGKYEMLFFSMKESWLHIIFSDLRKVKCTLINYYYLLDITSHSSFQNYILCVNNIFFSFT
jgi:hypothetical protein